MEMGMVSQHEIEELCKQFKRLDVTKSGFVDTEDLLLMQMLRSSSSDQQKGGSYTI